MMMLDPGQVIRQGIAALVRTLVPPERDTIAGSNQRARLSRLAAA